MDSLWRSFKNNDLGKGAVVLVVGHGLSNRLLCMRWFHWPPEVFNISYNPDNCKFLVLVKDDNEKTYRLTDDSLKILFPRNQNARQLIKQRSLHALDSDQLIAINNNQEVHVSFPESGPESLGREKSSGNSSPSHKAQLITARHRASHWSK